MRDFQVYVSGAHEDERRAARLARALRREGVPRSLWRPDRGDGAYQACIGPVFTHRRERPTATRLHDDMLDALARSERLIVLASPEAARSGWVAAEILAFRRAGRGGRILYIVPAQSDGKIAEGSPVAALPPAARFALGADGALTTRPEAPALAQIIDARGAGRGCGRRRVARLVAARLIDAAPETLTRRRRARGLRRWVAAVAVASVAVAGAAAIQTAERDAGRAAKLAAAQASAEAAAATAQAALDRGDAEAAYAALDEAFADQEADVFGAAFRDAPPSARAALARAQLEARLIAKAPAPGPAGAALRVLPGGALASVEADGRTHLIDLGAGTHKTVFAPDAPTHTRISADGETLWAAHFEPERIDETGARYTPLIFEEAELATGRVRLSTAVRSVQPFGDSAEFSLDGALFAADLGPGRGADTLIGVFRRTAQALAGVLALPSDRAKIHFAGAGALLAVIDPPSRHAGAPGIYLWRIGAPAPQVLRAPGLAPICPGRRAGGGEAGEGALAPQVLISPDRREAGLLLSDEAGGCLLRWSLPDGAIMPLLAFERPIVAGAILGASGPYLVAAPGAPYRLRLSAAEAEAAPLAGCRPGEGDAPRRLSPAGAPLVIRCAGGLVHFGAKGAVRWRPPVLDQAAAAYDPTRRRLVTAHPGRGDESGEGPRLLIWDAAPRARWLDRGFKAGRLVDLGRGFTLAIDDAGRANAHSGIGVRAAAAITPPDTQDIAIHPLEGGFGVTAKAGDRLSFALHDAAGGAARLRLEDLVAVSAAPDGGRVLTVDADGGAAWRDAASGEVLIETARVGAIFIDGAAHDEGYVLLARETAPGGGDPVLALYAKREGPPLRRIGSWRGRDGAVRVSPDGRRALVRIEGGGGAPDEYELVDLEPDGGAPRARLIADAPISTRGEATRFGFSPDGAVIWFAGPRGAGRAVRILDARDGALVRLAPLGGSAAPVFSKAGLLALGGGRLRIFARSGLGAPVCPGLGDTLAAPLGPIAVSPDGGLIAVASGAGAAATLTVFDLAACAPRLRRSITVTAAPVFAGPDRLRVAVRGALIELSLSAPPAEALDEIRARLAGIRRPD